MNALPELPDKRYNPATMEPRWYRFWLDRHLFHSDSTRGGQPYCVMIPPPNVTGILHMGHALNNTLQDVLVRWRRMQGRNTVWVPGTDHAGIATQNVVERDLQASGQTRSALGREAFVQRVWEWKEKYGRTIIEQLKRLGASCDWTRERFTMDPGLSRAVVEVFVRLYEKGLIYRGQYIVNWCPRCQTALADEESEHTEEDGHLWYIRYPVVVPGKSRPQRPPERYIVVATTRPETLLGDTAVAVHPRDTRYAGLTEQRIALPILERELRVVQDEFVSPEFGTGIVKVTPAHDPNDFAIAQRHGLPAITIFHEDGTLNEAGGPYRGLDRFECRKRLVADLQKQGLLEKIAPHRLAVGRCYRCDTIIEPRLSTQWFVRMKPLAEPAIQVVRDGRVTFTPARWTKVYLEWMENIRDWCISRQIWWGHRIPVFYCAGGHQWAARDVPARCPACGNSEIRQDPDVLDTWFSSWLWPFSTLGWPDSHRDLQFYYPTNDLVTASEIIFFWVARMIMAGLEFMGNVPFTRVYIHGTVRDEMGRKMSKSLGNIIDPSKVIDRFGADALRFSLLRLAATGQDVFLSDTTFSIGQKFGTKLWNAGRFLRLHSPPRLDAFSQPGPDAWGEWPLTPDDQHILARLQQVVAGVTTNLEKFRFNDAAHLLHEFLWHQYCDWYLEYAKDTLSDSVAGRKPVVLKILHYGFSTALRLLHPIMPFVTEELWHLLGYGGPEDSITVAPWPQPVSEDILCK